ncbi:MAG: 2Fe-2S iron-sulfur cluster-binding protein [Hyphomonadaceae bacterium]
MSEAAIRKALVRAARWEAEDIIAFVLEDEAGGLLPTWSPGAHIDVVLPSGLVRQYSLCGDPSDLRRYEIAVLHERAGRGGSRELHETQLVGASLQWRGPRNNFELTPAKSYLLIAGGVGVTPIITMAEALTRAGAGWRMMYGVRSRAALCFADRLRDLGAGVQIVSEAEEGRPNFEGFLRGAGAETAIYCCGPEGMIAAVDVARQRAAPEAILNVEHFAPPAAAAPPPGQAGEDFEIVLRKSGKTLRVAASATILETLRSAGLELTTSCETGVCGACETAVWEGRPDHRDCILSPQERAEGKTMMICVSRSLSPVLVLDI